MAAGASPRSLTLHDAAAIARTGDVFLFRGPSTADRAIRLATNSPVNHVGMVLAIDDLPPLIWHAELGRSLPDVWTGERHRGTQLHKLTDAVRVWSGRYGQQAWMRQIDVEIGPGQEDEVLRVVNEFDGRAFPKTAALAKGWVLGRAGRTAPTEALFCAEVVAITYERMGLLTAERPPNWYDPGKFWSGNRLQLVGATLGPEIEITDIGDAPDPGRPIPRAAREPRRRRLRLPRVPRRLRRHAT